MLKREIIKIIKWLEFKDQYYRNNKCNQDHNEISWCPVLCLETISQIIAFFFSGLDNFSLIILWFSFLTQINYRLGEK